MTKQRHNLQPAAGFAVPSKRSATRAPGSSPPARPKTTNFPHHTLLWPGDHRWFVATDVDSDFTWAGGSNELIDAVIGYPKLKAERVHRL